MAQCRAVLTNWQRKIERRSRSDRQRVSAMAVSFATIREICEARVNGYEFGRNLGSRGRCVARVSSLFVKRCPFCGTALAPVEATTLPSPNHIVYLISELLTNAIFLLSGDHDGTLIVPCPPYR